MLQICERLEDNSVKLVPLEQADLAAQIAAGMGYASEQGVVHSALTLQQCLLTNRNRVKLTGFDLYFTYRNRELFDEARESKELPIKVRGRCSSMFGRSRLCALLTLPVLPFF